MVLYIQFPPKKYTFPNTKFYNWNSIVFSSNYIHIHLNKISLSTPYHANNKQRAKIAVIY